MNKLLMIMLAAGLTLSACASAPSAAIASSPAESSLAPSARLILGTLKLEGTAEAVTARQAAALLPLWQVYQGLQESGTAAQEEIDALVQQIQETMTSSQVQSMQAMSLTQADIMSVMVEQNIAEAGPQQAVTRTASGSGPQAGPEGGMPPADMGGEPGMVGAAAPVSASSSTGGSSSSQVQAGSGVPSALLDALIQLLETRIARAS
ncbi:MAG: hypothetical protein ACM3QS_17905 [Bacteroidota bacterium]